MPIKTKTTQLAGPNQGAFNLDYMVFNEIVRSDSPAETVERVTVRWDPGQLGIDDQTIVPDDGAPDEDGAGVTWGTRVLEPAEQISFRVGVLRTATEPVQVTWTVAVPGEQEPRTEQVSLG